MKPPSNRAVMRYYGGKHKLAHWVVEYLPPHRVYVEPFCGAASVFFRKEPSYGEVLNDLAGDIVTFFRVLQDDRKREELRRLLLLTPFAREEYFLAHEATADPVERSRRLLIRSMMGYHSDSVNIANNKSGFRHDCNRSWTLPVHNWRDYPEYLDGFAHRLRDAVIENIDAFRLFEKWRYKADYLWYVDPPYPHHTRTAANRHKYVVEMSDDDHRRLVDVLRELAGMVVLSGYPTDLYRPLEADGWIRLEKKIRNTTYQAGERTECLWINPAAQKGGALR